MVQEVQQQGNWYQTPNEIQGIGEIRRRVREHTQVTPGFTYQATFSCQVGLGVEGPGYSGLQKGTFTKSSQRGLTEFRILDGDIIIPLAGPYLVNIKVWGGASGVFTIYHYLNNGSKSMYQTTTTNNSESGATQVEFTENFGRYNSLNYRAKVYMSTSGGGSSRAYIKITLTRL